MSKLNRFLVEALRKEFPFLREWKPEIHEAEHPVTFVVSRVLDPNIIWSLELGRYNNTPDERYTNGIVAVAISNGNDLKWVDLPEGKTSPADILRQDTRFVLTKDCFRAELTGNDPGFVKYTLYKSGEESVAAIKAVADRQVAMMAAELV